MTSTDVPTPFLIQVSLRRLLPFGLLATAVAAAGAALLVDSDAIDTVLGAVTGASAVLLLAVVLLQVLTARAERRARDREALDGLEPLRAAQRDSRRPAPRAPRAPGTARAARAPQAGGSGPGPDGRA